MSCGNHHDTDCSEVLAEVWLFLDNECDESRRAALTQHLDECSPCLAQYGLDEKLKALLATKCGGEHAPPSLKARLREKLKVAVLQETSITVESVTVESDASGTTVEVRSTSTSTYVERRG
jgi:mycothiol system anti-sigma-R factor